MARPAPVPGVEPARGLRRNARRVLAVRIEELYGFERAVADPSRVAELHDLRIACKRLRYLLEIFTPAFRADLAPFVAEVRALQDLLGDIHDRDVQVPRLQEHLGWLEEREREAVRAALTGRRRPPPAPVDGDREAQSEADYRRFRGRLERARRDEERPGVHALIARHRRERDELYARFRGEWRRLKEERFRSRLESALGL